MVVEEYYIKRDDPEIPQEVMSINSSIFDFIDNDHNQILFTNKLLYLHWSLQSINNLQILKDPKFFSKIFIKMGPSIFHLHGALTWTRWDFRWYWVVKNNFKFFHCIIPFFIA